MVLFVEDEKFFIIIYVETSLLVNKKQGFFSKEGIILKVHTTTIYVLEIFFFSYFWVEEQVEIPTFLTDFFLQLLLFHRNILTIIVAFLVEFFSTKVEISRKMSY